MISTQAQALGIDTTAPGAFSVKQCNQIANISKRTIKAAIIGVPIAEVIEKFGGIDTGGESLLLPAVQNIVKNTVDSKMDSYNAGKGASVDSLNTPGSFQKPQITDDQIDGWILEYPGKSIRAIYKTVDQIKTKYGQVRPQDRVRLNNRVEQKLIKCREMTNLEDAEDNDYNE